MPIDWDRWHELLDIRAQRALAPSEQAEYQQFARIVARLDAEAARVSEQHLRKRLPNRAYQIPDSSP